MLVAVLAWVVPEEETVLDEAEADVEDEVEIELDGGGCIRWNAFESRVVFVASVITRKK